jgi:tetratricopeptide (TPR) repeat protein
MFPKPLRFVLIGVSTAYGLYYVTHGQPIGYLYLLAGALLIYGYFRYGPVFIAFHHIRRKNFARAESLLAQVRDPELLSTGQRSYFELASAELAIHRGDHGVAERHLRTALDHRLRSENDRALAEALLGQLLIERGAVAEAREALERARQRPCQPGVAKAIEEAFKSLPGEGP